MAAFIGSERNFLGKLFLLVTFLSLILIVGRPCYGLNMLYPLYSYPNWYNESDYIWDDIVLANQQIDITAVINPNSGPGGDQDPNSDYIHGLTDLANGGVNMIGYVPTGYGTRDIEAVKADIYKYYSDFVLTSTSVISGIFLDEASASVDPSILDYYSELYDYVKSFDGFDTVVLNHGVNVPEQYMQLADINVVYESTYEDWLSYEPLDYMERYGADQFAVIIPDTPLEEQMEIAIDLAAQRAIGNIFITDDINPNPYDDLPSYWPSQVDLLAKTNPVPEPGTFWLMSLALVGLSFVKKRQKGIH